MTQYGYVMGVLGCGGLAVAAWSLWCVVKMHRESLKALLARRAAELGDSAPPKGRVTRVGPEEDALREIERQQGRHLTEDEKQALLRGVVPE